MLGEMNSVASEFSGLSSLTYLLVTDGLRTARPKRFVTFVSVFSVLLLVHACVGLNWHSPSFFITRK